VAALRAAELTQFMTEPVCPSYIILQWQKKCPADERSVRLHRSYSEGSLKSADKSSGLYCLGNSPTDENPVC